MRLLVLISLLLNGCYLSKTISEQLNILVNREHISQILNQKKAPELKNKLKLVLSVREFTKSIGLTPQGSYLTYSDLKRDILSYLLVSSKTDSFSIKTWWFPILGDLPYKGFFDKSDAIKTAEKLREDNYESSIRGVQAYSTLGWFDDPVLSTILNNHNEEIINTIIHEIVHNTIWIKNSVSFNESLANFIGIIGTEDFLIEKKLLKEEQKGVIISKQLQKAKAYNYTYRALNKLYLSKKDRFEKQKIRNIIYQNCREKFPAILPKQLNNAEIIQYYLYLKGLKAFYNLYQKNNLDLSKFINTVKAVDHWGKDPYKTLNKLSESGLI